MAPKDRGLKYQVSQVVGLRIKIESGITEDSGLIKIADIKDADFTSPERL